MEIFAAKTAAFAFRLSDGDYDDDDVIRRETAGHAPKRW